MKVIGLTGGIGSGKSTVSGFLNELGAVVINADAIGHEILDTDAEVQREIVTVFGEQVINKNGVIDRTLLGRIVFSDPEARIRLNRITHPLIYARIRTKLEEYRRRNIDIVILEVPLLLDTGSAMQVDEVWVTTAPEATILKRLNKRAGLSKRESLARIHSQLDSEEQVKYADVVIDTNCSLDKLKAKLSKLWEKLQNEKGRKKTRTTS